MAGQLERIEADVADLKGRFARHEERHGDEADMLALVLNDLAEHRNNAHGRTSTIKQGGAVGLGVTLLYLVAEVVRTFLL